MGAFLVGLRSRGSDIPVHGICIRRPADAQRVRVLDRARAAAGLLGRQDLIEEGDINVDDAYLGPGYGLPDEKLMEGIQLAASCEALFVDPVYSGKAMAGLIGLVCARAYLQKTRTLFSSTLGGHLPCSLIPGYSRTFDRNCRSEYVQQSRQVRSFEISGELRVKHSFSSSVVPIAGDASGLGTDDVVRATGHV